ncbi:hypothetical protein [Streptosporangium amethystogenes]|uniref:hypothetical protein n=1 Tax=Streptosporangium amethystogenes TaxID=2002 RepID=UPI0004C8F0CF|nr:hypothetical protein [Streptosporangium amethystogenes]
MPEQSSLEQVITRFGPMPPQRAAVVGLAVLDQLVAMHRQGMLHGDVRPSSVLLGPYEQITLAAPSLPSTLFTSPEGVTSPAADLWSLGATLYTAVEGRPPSPGGSLDNAGPIAPVLFRLLAGDPSQRPDPDTLRKILLDISQYRPEPPPAPLPVGAPSQASGPAGPAASVPFTPAAPVPFTPAAPAAFGQATLPAAGAPAPQPPGGLGAPGAGQEGGTVPVTEAEVTAPLRKNLTEQISAVTAGLTLQDVPAPQQAAPPPSNAPTAWQGPIPPLDTPAAWQSPLPGPLPGPPQGPPHPGVPFQHGFPPPHPNPPDEPTSVEPVPVPEATRGTADEPTERSTRATGILVPRPVVALTGVLLFGMAVSIGILLTSVLANADDDISAEPSGAKGRFATAPRACGLLDDKQVNQLVPGFNSSEVEHSACDWLNRYDWRKPNVEKYDLRVRLIAQKQNGSEVARAKEYLAGKKKDILDKGQFATPKPLPPKDLRGIGEEAFTSGGHNSINLYGGSYKTTVVFRISNLIAEVDYERGGVQEDPDGKITEGALQAARWLAESLKTDG